MIYSSLVSRRGLGALAATAMIAFTAPPLAAQDFPSRTIQIVNPYPAGSTTDGLTRALAPGLEKRLGQPVVVVNRPGAAGTVGTDFVARAAPDGYTLVFMPALTLSVLPAVRQTGYKPDDLVPICQTFSNAMAVVAPPDSPFDSLTDLVEAARARPGDIDYGHQGVASIPHLAMVELVQNAKIDIVDIPYGGEPAVMVDLMGGRIDVASIVLGSASGRDLKILAIFAPERHPDFPDVPTAVEQGFDVSPASFGGVFAPHGTPDEIIAKLSDACEGAAHDEAYVKAARSAFQPKTYFAPADSFARAIEKDIADKAALLETIELPQ